MKIESVIFILFFYQASSTTIFSSHEVEKDNERPIIGVLSQEVSFALETIYPGMYKSFIAASYVKFIEGAGGRVVPIWIGKERSYYEDLMNKINGVLFPGGATWFNQSNGYADAGEHIYKIARGLNEAGDYFPLWGTCLGFELLTYLSADRREHRADCKSDRQALHLDFKNDFKSSKMFQDASNEIITILSEESVTSNFHKYCVTEKNLTAFDMDDEWRVLSVNNDFDGFNFISTIESKRFPFYGVQFHPEKNIYEWVPNRNISHSRNSVKANSYFAEFFVSEARRSQHKFDHETEEEEKLIYNFPATFTGIQGSSYEQCYLFT